VPTVTKTTDANTANSAQRADTRRTPAFTKQVAVVDMFQRDIRAILADLAATTGWLPHTVRAALIGLRKRGLNITDAKVAGEIRDTIVEGVV